jgi:hypothetical protein
MESIIETSTEDESGINPESHSKKSIRSPDRVTLNAAETAKVDRWLKQVHEASRGFLDLSRSEMVNFIVKEHREEFVPAELKRVRSDHYDPIRHMQWIMPQIKEAWSRADHARVAELQEELRGVELSAVRSTDQTSPKDGLEGGCGAPIGESRRRRKQKARSDSNESGEVAEMSTGIAKTNESARRSDTSDLDFFRKVEYSEA